MTPDQVAADAALFKEYLSGLPASVNVGELEPFAIFQAGRVTLDNLSGAAVRGEPVAGRIAPWQDRMSQHYAAGNVQCHPADVFMAEEIRDLRKFIRTMPVSARAADAPSEPSELAKLLREAIAQNVIPFPAQILAAADALDSQPTEASASRESIADDARFVTLLNGYVIEREHAGRLSRAAAYSDLVAYIDSRAPAAQAASVPKGWKLVPIEPTQSMCEQGYYEFGPDGQPDAANMWRAMIRATPAPQQEGSEADNG